jgi:hypothetical protein
MANTAGRKIRGKKGREVRMKCLEEAKQKQNMKA